MATLDATVFLMMVGLAGFFLFASFKVNYVYDAIFKLLALILWMAIALFLTAEYQIQWTETTTDVSTGKVFETIKPLIASDYQIIAMIFYILGLASAILFFKAMTDYKEFKDSQMEQINW